jgi:hypothetical protein
MKRNEGEGGREGGREGVLKGENAGAGGFEIIWI